MGRLRTALPKPIGTTAAYGESDLPARADHVHAIDSASLATALQDAVNRVTGGGGITTAQAQAIVAAAVANEASTRSSADAGLSLAIANESTARQDADAALDAAKVDIGTGIDAQRVLVGENTTTAGGSANLTWDGTKLAVATRTASVRYRHVQGSPSATWVIAHNLDEYPSVTVVDSSGNVCLGDVKYDSTNQITLTFGAAFAGNAYLN